MASKDRIKNMREKSQERRIEVVEEFADELVEKLGDKVMCVAVWGSVPKGEHAYDSDIDTLVILDDTKLQNDVPKDARNKIKSKVTELAKETDERITIQYFPFLTEFWDSLRKGEPLAIEAVRNGEPVYDTGIFMPAKRLLERGKIEATRETVKKRLKMAAAGFKKAEREVKSSVPHKLEQAMANAGQAPVMFIGKQPPAKENVPEVLEEMFVDDGTLDEKYTEIAEELHNFGNKGEKNPEDVSGEELDEMLEKADDFVRRMHELVSELGSQQKIQGMVHDYKRFLKANVAKLRQEDIEPPEDREDLPDAVVENLDVSESHREMFEQWEEIIQKIKDENVEEINEKKLYELKESSREFVSKVEQEIKDLKDDQAPEITPEMDETKIAEAAETEEMIPNLDEKAEKQVKEEKEEDE